MKRSELPGAARIERPGTLLVVGAYPGDADMAVGGSVARWVAEGAVAHLVCGTSGEAGGSDASADPLQLASRCEAEQRKAAAILGYADVTFLHRPDGAVANDLALREQLVRLSRSLRPDTVATWDPRVIISGAGRIRSADQRATGAATIDAIYPAAGSAMAFPHLVRAEGLEPHRVARLYLFGAEEPDTRVDIAATLDAKLEALRVHASQQARFGDLHAVAAETHEAFAVIELA